MQRKREHLWIGFLVAGGALAAFLLLLRDTGDGARRRVELERATVARLRAVARAEAAFHARQGRYGWAEELRDAGLVEAGWLAPDNSLPVAGYRIDVLLPYGRNPQQQVRIAPRGARKAHPRLEERHFALVARPWSAQATGYRTYYLDDSGELLISEGVSEIDGGFRPQLPELLLVRTNRYSVSGMHWISHDAVQPR